MTEAKTILKRNIDKYHQSTLFIYFQGRVERIEVNSKIFKFDRLIEESI